MAGTALVVGGSGGIGAAVARRLADDWDHVVVGYRSNAAAAEAIATALPSASVARIDLCERATLAEELHRLGPLRGVVLASGVSIEQPFVVAASESAWRKVIETELLGAIALVSALLPGWRTTGGSLVAVTSFANVHFPPGDALSSVPKAGIEALCRAIAKEEGRHGVRANSVAPGIAEAVAFLLSDRAGYISGQTLVVDGGQSL